MKKRKPDFPKKLFTITAIILLALLFILGYIWRVLSTSEYFSVRRIVSKEELGKQYSYLEGKNIFTLDLSAEAAVISRGCPDCSKVRLARILPNRIFVEFIRRKPLAFLKLNRYFAIDETGVIFNSPLNPEESGFPVITGVESRGIGIKAGNRLENRNIAVALAIIKEANRDRLLKDYRIQKIDAGAIDNITLEIPLEDREISSNNWKTPQKKQFLEVKIGQGNIAERVAIMAGLINQEKHNLGNIKYIDLRFKEPVIKFRDAK